MTTSGAQNRQSHTNMIIYAIVMQVQNLAT